MAFIVATASPAIPVEQKEVKGLILGRYELGKILGYGMFAKVYHARNVKNGDGVAIKVIDKNKILKAGLDAHIKREILILRRLRHRNIVQLFEVMATKSKIFFVMEYARGGELFRKVAKGPVRDDIARKYFHQLISAVAFCHARGVYHRDLKPENILLDDDGNLKVSDFGLSAMSEQIRQDGLFHTFCGTPAYVAPEVLARKGYDAAKVDVWSCGVILFVLMAGYLPFFDQNVMSMYNKINKGEFQCPRWFSPELVLLLSRLLDTNPETRITIPELMSNTWFKKGFNVDSLSEQPLPDSEPELETRRKMITLPRPATLNAFDIISFSRGFDLSGLFEDDGAESGGARFLSGAPMSSIVAKLEEIAEAASLTVKKKKKENGKGPLTIETEILELTPSLRMVVVRRNAGDRSEYEEFCDLVTKRI